MLRELHVRNLAVAEAIDLEFDGGFTVVTGETGAGKSILIDALALVLGARPDPGSVRTGAEALVVEARFELARKSGGFGAARRILEPLSIPFDGDLLIVRTVPASGRSSARINDRGVTQATLTAIGGLLADIHGQNDNISLLRPSEQLILLDRFAGLVPQRDEFALKAQALRDLRGRIDELSGDDRERARRVTQLKFEADEIEAARLTPGEDDQLSADLDRLAHAQDLVQLAETAREALEDENAAVDALGRALAAAQSITEIDESATEAREVLDAAQDQAAEGLRLIRHYIDGIELDPARLGEVEARLSVIHDLQRRYGDTVTEIIAHGEQAAAEAVELDSSVDRIEALREAEQALASETAVSAMALSRTRRDASQELLRRVTKEAKRLQLPYMRLEGQFGLDDASESDEDALLAIDLGPVLATVDGLTPLEGAESMAATRFDLSGVDRVEILVSFNPDLPPRPLARVASGGETARLMLAVKTVLGRSDEIPTLVFDEVDVGLGGRSGGVVGDALRRLARSHQVLCITHLPQVAAYSNSHLQVQKSVNARESRVTVEIIQDDARVRELAEMLGADTEANRRAASELLASVQDA